MALTSTLGRGLLATVAVVILRSCAPVTVQPLDAQDADSAAEDAVIEAPPPPPEVALADLAPYSLGDPRGEAARAISRAIGHFEQGEFEESLSALQDCSVAPGYASDLVAWQRGQALRRLERPAEAAAAWETISPGSRLGAEALLQRGQLALDAGEFDEVVRLLTPPEPAEDGTSSAPAVGTRLRSRSDAVLARALRARAAEGDLEEAYRLCVQIWTAEGRSTAPLAEAEACLQELADSVPAQLHPGLEEQVSRSRSLGAAHANDSVVKLLGDRVEALKALPPEQAELGCEGVYQLGRAWHKKRKYDRSVPLLSWAAESCPAGDVRIRAHYLQAQGLGRAGRSTEAIAAWVSLADRYPEHNYADDGLFHAGIELLEREDFEAARTMFTDLADRFPEGDMVGAGLWGMAWASLSEGKPADALPWLERQADGDPWGPNRSRVLQATYWHARASLDVAAKAEDQAQRSTALEALHALASEHPTDWYGLLAAAKLREEDSARADELDQQTRTLFEELRRQPEDPERFVIQEEFLERPGLEDGIELLRGGLGPLAAEEFLRALGESPHDSWDLPTLLFASHLLAEADDPYQSHHLLRLAFRDRFPPLDDNARPLLLHAYPLAYHELIVDVTSEYEWSPMTFQGLVREESAFSPEVRSWAGAMGLSQLMWPTARATARKMGIKGLRRSDLSDPRTNLDIGATYFQGLHRRWKGHLPLSMASYNAGPNAVQRWVDRRGSMPLDAWVETIPYKQTRLYVKKVSASWQTYHALYGDLSSSPWTPLRAGPINKNIGGKSR